VQSTVRKEDVKYAEWKKECDRVLRQKTIFKSIVAFSLFVLFITGFLLCSAGVNGFKSAVVTGVETLDIVEGKMREGSEFLKDVLRLSQSINSDVNSLLVSLNGICPAQTNQICSNLNDTSSCQSLYGLNIVPQMQKAISYINDDATHEQMIQDARTALDYIATQIANVDTDLDPANQTLAASVVFGIILILISSFLLSVLFIPMPEVVGSALFSLSYRLIFAVILFCFLLLLAVLPVSSAVGDFCYDDPGLRIETILQHNMDTSSSSDQIADFVFNIFKGCSAPDARFVENIDFLTEGMRLVGSFDPSIAEFKENAAICNTSSSAIESLETTLNDEVNVHLCEVSNRLTELSDIFACRFWHPIFVQAAHESLCYQGMDALSAITNTLFVILCMSLLIMTFRVSLWDAIGSPLQDVSEQKKKQDCGDTMSTENTRQGESFMIPKKRIKKKKKLKSKHREPEEGVVKTESTFHEFAGIDVEVTRKRKKRGHKKKKKRHSRQQGEADVHVGASEPEAHDRSRRERRNRRR